MVITTGILLAIVCLLVGGIVVYIMIKRFNKQQIKAFTHIAVSEKEDEKRTEIIDEINIQIEKNKEAMENVKKTLNSNSD